MSGNQGKVTEIGLQFFGKMSASISHEIKNSLAIINESAGLLEDITLLAEKGIPMDPGRLKALAGKVMNQIRRADGIVKKMNKFAHSVDEAEKGVDLGELLDLVVGLSLRFASMKGVEIATNPPASPVFIRTNPFFLENLVWLCLEYAMDAAGETKRVQLAAEKKERGAVIRITGLGGAATQAKAFPEEKTAPLLEMLGAACKKDVASGELVLSLPGAVDG